MLQFSKISPKDIERYNKYREKAPSNASEASFTTLFIWDGYYNLECSENGEFFFLRFNIKNREPSYFFPIGSGNIKKAIDELSEYAQSRGEKLCFRLVSKENKDKLFALCGDRFSVKESRDSFDYVYLTEKMITLSGACPKKTYWMKGKNQRTRKTILVIMMTILSKMKKLSTVKRRTASGKTKFQRLMKKKSLKKSHAKTTAFGPPHKFSRK